MGAPDVPQVAVCGDRAMLHGVDKVDMVVSV
jgi:hypothetical protein